MKTFDLIPEHILLPKPMGIDKLAELYGRSTSTIQRNFKRLKIAEAIGQPFGTDYSTNQILVIFYLYFPPVKFYRSFLWLEQHGFIDWIVTRYCSKHYLQKKI